MRKMTISTRMYLFAVYLAGALFFSWNLLNWEIKEPLVLAASCVLASLALIIKVEGATNRSHYTLSFILYGFAFAHLGIPQAAIVIFVSNLVEFLVNRPPWYIQVFNTACYFIVINAAGFVFHLLNPGLALTTPIGVLALTLGMTVFTLLNHLIVGIIVWMARGENFKQSGIFDLFPLVIDLTLLTLGAMLVIVWDYSPFALLLFALPIYLLYGTMHVPALERQSETDQKTGLFNHPYFMQQLESELKRANRFDRPLTIIMADLDMLRNINNTYGHLAGDEVICTVAKIFREAAREYDVVARFGGEEFMMFMPETDLDQGYKRAEVIRRAVEEAEISVQTSVTPIKATLSLGIATRESSSQTGKDIIHNADTALFHSKLKGRNSSFAYTEGAYLQFTTPQKEASEFQDDPIETTVPPDHNEIVLRDYQTEKTSKVSEPVVIASTVSKNGSRTSPKMISKNPVYLYIGGLFAFSLLGFGGLYLLAPELYAGLNTQSWLGLAGCAILVIFTEWFSIDLYTKQTSLSTSAVPILAGTLLFGPLASFVLSLTYALVSGIKHRSSFNRYVFNFSNQLLAGIFYLFVIYIIGKSFALSSTLLQLTLAVLSAAIVYTLNTTLITIGVHLDMKIPVVKFWMERYSWLFPIYLGMGVVAAAFVFGYKHDPLIGSLLVLVPLLLLRISQVQYVERTRELVVKLRKNNLDFERYSDEITKLNDGLLDTLAEIIDMRDPHVLGHSRRVADFAAKLAIRLRLNEKQVELVRKGSLLHDIGKLGISKEILAKPGYLTPEEFNILKTHCELGSGLLEKSPHLQPLIPIVRYHHEFYNGRGYPDQIAGHQIPIEARIVSVADAVEAMASDRPYQRARSTQYIIKELCTFSDAQFDPMVVDAAIQILNETEDERIMTKATQPADAQLR